MQQAQASVQKTLAEAKEEEAKAIKWQAEAMSNQPNEIDIQIPLPLVKTIVANWPVTLVLWWQRLWLECVKRELQFRHAVFYDTT